MRRAPLPLTAFVLIFSFIVLGVLDVRSNPGRDPVDCEHLHRDSLARLEASWGLPPGMNCTEEVGPVYGDAAPTLALTLHPSNGTVTVNGTRFTANATVAVDLRTLSHGVVEGPYSFAARTDEAGRFVSQPIRVSCPDSDRNLYILADDATGGVSAGTFSVLELDCGGE